MSTMATQADEGSSRNGVIELKDRAAWKAALQSPRPVLAHLNADTTWLLQLPIPRSLATSPRSNAKSKSAPKDTRRSRYNILIDPWLDGPQSDVASWFSTQWHVVVPAVPDLQELDKVLAELEDGETDEEAAGAESYIDCVAISHEFTDHCHEATLRELPRSIPVVATEKAAELIRSWNHFDRVITTPAFSAATPNWRDVLVDSSGALPPWLGIGRVVTQGNALYYHSAVLVAFDLGYVSHQRATRSKDKAAHSQSESEAVIYSPHGINSSDLECIREANLKTLALLHGLHDVKIWMTAQLNLGALNGIQAVRASGARYWVATHDESKRGGGLISWFLQRTSYSLRDAVESEEAKDRAENDGSASSYKFLELGSGDGMVLL